MNCFCGMVDRRKAFNLISSRDHCQRSSPSQIFDTPRAGFEPAQNLSSGLIEWSCAVVINTISRYMWLVSDFYSCFFFVSKVIQATDQKLSHIFLFRVFGVYEYSIAPVSIYSFSVSLSESSLTCIFNYLFFIYIINVFHNKVFDTTKTAKLTRHLL